MQTAYFDQRFHSIFTLAAKDDTPSKSKESPSQYFKPDGYPMSENQISKTDNPSSPKSSQNQRNLNQPVHSGKISAQTKTSKEEPQKVDIYAQCLADLESFEISARESKSKSSQKKDPQKSVKTQKLECPRPGKMDVSKQPGQNNPMENLENAILPMEEGNFGMQESICLQNSGSNLSSDLGNKLPYDTETLMRANAQLQVSNLFILGHFIGPKTVCYILDSIFVLISIFGQAGKSQACQILSFGFSQILEKTDLLMISDSCFSIVVANLT